MESLIGFLFVGVELVALGSGSSVILCPFWRIQRSHFAVEFCDNLRDGVPSCVADGFYPDIDPHSFKNIREYHDLFDSIKICSHFVRSDVWCLPIVKRGCLFGGDVCIHFEDKSFKSCVGCSRFHV